MIQKVNYKYILIIGGVLYFLISIWNLAKFNVPVVIHDEFGYLANAAFLAGKDWSGVTSISPYYSYGYSLLLVPLFWFDLTPEIMYKIIILMNVLFYLVSYVISFVCFCKLFKSYNRAKLALFCTIVMFYGAYIFNSHVVWVEAFIYMLFWISIYVLISIQDNAKYYKLVLFAFLLTYMYVVHQRAIGVVCCGIVAVILLVFNKKVTLKQLLTFIIMMGLCFILHNIVKDYITAHIWSQPIVSNLKNINDYGGQITKLIDVLTSPVSFLKVIRGILAKYLYLIISSASIVVFGLYYCIKKFVQYIQRKEQLPIIEIYCFLSLLASITISSIFFYQSQRLDTIIYGRYSEFVLTPLLIFGLYELSQWKFSLKTIGLIYVYILFIAAAIYQYMTKYETFLYVCTVNAAPFFRKSTYQFMFLLYIIFGLLLCGMFYFCWTRKKQIFKIVSCVILICYWNYAVYDVYSDDIYACQSFGYNMGVIANEITNINNQLPIYYVYDYNSESTDKNRQIEILQYLLPDNTITIIQIEEISCLTGVYYLAFPQGMNIDLDDYTIITQANGVILSIPSNSQILENINNNQYILTSNMLSSDFSQNIRFITPMLGVNEGDYKVYIKLDNEEEMSAKFEFVSNGEIVYSEKIDLYKGNQDLFFDITCSQNQNTYFIFYADNCEKVGIDLVSFTNEMY